MKNLKLNDQEKSIKNLLAKSGIIFEVFVTHELVQNEGGAWVYDEFRVVFAKDSKKYWFDFKQSIGHRVSIEPAILESAQSADDYKVLKLALKRSNDKNLYNKNQPAWRQKQWLVLPTAASVLYCLLLDSIAYYKSFAEWCREFGYDEDSRKALADYLECQATGQKLGFLSSIRSQIETILEDY
jgi:hypothetical protein